MRTLLPALVALALAAPAAPAAAQSVLVGSSMGFSLYSPSNSSRSLKVIGLPGNSAGLQPGLRLGVTTPGGPEVYLDAGLVSESYGGETQSSLVTSMNLLYSFDVHPVVQPYVTAGAGLIHVSDGYQGSTSALLGGGLGVREKVSQGHAAFRQEVRLDYITQSDDIRKGTLFGVRVGFDFWIN